jgi:hypothetical protein
MKRNRCAAGGSGCAFRFLPRAFAFRFALVLLFKTAYYLLFGLSFRPVKNLSKTRDTQSAVAAWEKIAANL